MALSDYEDALKSFIHDDEKLVTYKWLSKEFEIHINLAKDILKQYWEKYKNKEEILATLLLIGRLKDGSIRVSVVRESDVESVKKKFVKIDCEHLYSIQKSLPDIELLALVGGTDLRYSAIKCNEKYIRSDDEIEALRYVGNIRKEESKSVKPVTTTDKPVEKPAPKKVESPPTEKPKKQSVKKNDIKETEKPEVKEKEDSESTATQDKKKSPPNKANNNNLKSNNKTSKKPVQSKQSGFNHLFGKVPAKPQTPPTKPAVSENNKQSSSPGITEKEEKPASKGADTKLSKEKEKPNKIKDQEKEKPNKTKVQEKEKPSKTKEQEKEKSHKIKDQEKEKKETQEKENRHSQSEEKSKKVSKTEEKTKPKVKADTRGKKRNRSQEKNTLSKRKRIVVQESSEDESGKSDNDEEEPMIVDEEPPKVLARRSPSPPAEKRENGKRMVRKTIDKTFKDEDGYLVTKRVHVYEAVSDDEVGDAKETEPQKPKPTEVQAKKKQTTLMNFFKKS